MSVPAAHLNREYIFYVGDRVGTVSLWERHTNDYPDIEYEHERPIYSNSRGQGVWFSNSPDEYHNTEPVEPTDAFYAAINEIADGETGRIDVGDCEWYEREVVNSVIGLLNEGAATDGIRDLIRHASGYSGGSE